MLLEQEDEMTESDIHIIEVFENHIQLQWVNLKLAMMKH